MKDDYDGAEPSGNSLATDLFLRLAHVSGDGEFAPHGLRALAASAAKVRAQPNMAPQLLFSAPEHFIVRVADDSAAKSAEVLALLQEQRRTFNPFSCAFSLTDAEADRLAELSPFLAGLKREKRITIYHCQNLTCQLPMALD